jgi:signal transduction histidine kinase
VIRSSQPFVPVDLAALTKDVLGDLEVRIEKTGARVIVGELPAIEADPMQMRQLVQNLVSNALKFQPPDATPEVRISARIFEQPDAVPSAEGINGAHAAERQVCELTFQDNGIGFDEKYVDRIFAVFQRLHGRSEYEGTGVGLAVCRRIADRHNGAIVAKSEPGQGATFIVTLPVRQMKGEK